MVLGADQGLQDLVGCLHRHTTEIRHQMCTMRVTSKTTLCAKLAYYVIENPWDIILEDRIPVHRLAFFRPKGSR